MLLAKPRHQIVETVICVLAGWLCVLGFKPLFPGIRFSRLLLLLAGGIAFTLGAVVYSLKAEICSYLLAFAGDLRLSVDVLFDLFLSIE